MLLENLWKHNDKFNSASGPKDSKHKSGMKIENCTQVHLCGTTVLLTGVREKRSASKGEADFADS